MLFPRWGSGPHLLRVLEQFGSVDCFLIDAGLIGFIYSPVISGMQLSLVLCWRTHSTLSTARVSFWHWMGSWTDPPQSLLMTQHLNHPGSWTKEVQPHSSNTPFILKHSDQPTSRGCGRLEESQGSVVGQGLGISDQEYSLIFTQRETGSHALPQDVSLLFLLDANSPCDTRKIGTELDLWQRIDSSLGKKALLLNTLLDVPRNTLWGPGLLQRHGVIDLYLPRGQIPINGNNFRMVATQRHALSISGIKRRGGFCLEEVWGGGMVDEQKGWRKTSNNRVRFELLSKNNFIQVQKVVTGIEFG